MRHLIAPSLLSADFLDLRKDVEMINQSEADWLHLDIMDGVFVPNISFGFPVLNALKPVCQKPMDVHLMIVEPQKFIREVADAGAYMMNVHYEACTHLHRTVGAIHDAGMKAGVTLNPHSPVSLLDLRKDVEMINQSEADWLHLDIMDGVFVPNISFGFPVLNALKPVCQKLMDVHLMIVEPQKFIREVADAGAYMMNVHYEACTHLHRTVGAIHDAGMKAGVTLNPHSPVSLLEDIIDDVDMVLLMSVNPGFGGQKFIQHTVEKTARLRELIDRRNANTLIEVDGGVNLETGKLLVDAGADVLVAGNFVFKSPDPHQTIQALKAL